MRRGVVERVVDKDYLGKDEEERLEPAKEKPMKGMITEWTAAWDNNSPNDPHFHILGHINGGEEIITSRVLSIVENIATTANSRYRLGLPNLRYGRMAFPQMGELN